MSDIDPDFIPASAYAEAIDVLTRIDPKDFEECNGHEINRFGIALAFAQSVLSEAIENWNRQQREKAAGGESGLLGVRH